MSCSAPVSLPTFGFAPDAAPTAACNGWCQNASPLTGTWWICCGSSFSPCSIYRGQPDVGVARARHHGLAGLDGFDLRDDMGAIEGPVQPRGCGGRDIRDRRGEGQLRDAG